MRRAERQGRALQALRAGSTRKAAASFAGAGRSTFYGWLQDAGFARRVEDAESTFLVGAAGLVYRLGHEGRVRVTTRPDGTVIEERSPGDWRALAWLLERRHPDDYGEPKRRHEVSGPDGRPVEVNYDVLLRAMLPDSSDEERDAILLTLLELIEAADDELPPTAPAIETAALEEVPPDDPA